MRNLVCFGAVLPLCVLMGALPVRADGVLEQMQNEVTALAAQTRRAVVSIQEDETAVDYATRYRVSFTTPSLSKQAQERQHLQTQMQQAFTRLKSAETTFHNVRAHYAEGSPRFMVAEARLADARAEVSKVQGDLSRVGITSFVVNQETAGTGFCIGDGYIVTTADVVDGMKNPVVITDAGAHAKARLIGVDKRLNLGLLQAQDDLPALTLGDSDGVMAGNFAVSVGIQSGQTNSVALVTIGGLLVRGMTIGATNYPRLLEIAGTVGEGSSGAPLINVKGEVIGMLAAMAGRQDRNVSASGNVTFIVKQGQQHTSFSIWSMPLRDKTLHNQLQVVSPPKYVLVMPPPPSEDAPASVQSAGFAVPINDLKPLIEKLKTGKPGQEGWLGLKTEEKQPIAGHSTMTLHDVLVSGIYPFSPAYKADIRPGDEVWNLNDKSIGSLSDFRRFMLGVQVGDKVDVILGRDGKPVRCTLTVAVRPDIIPSPITKTAKQLIHNIQRH